MIEHVRDSVSAVCERVLVVGGAGADLPDDRPGSGPLAALATAFAHLPDDALFVTACDMPLLTTEVIAAVIAAPLGDGVDAAVARTPDGRPQPLVASYHRRVVPSLQAPGDASLNGLLRRIRVIWIDPPGPGEWARNVNRLSDLPHLH